MPGSTISGGAARAAAVVWWSQRHRRLPPQAEFLSRSLTSSALELAHKTAAAAAPVLLEDLICSAGPSSLPDLRDDLIVLDYSFLCQPVLQIRKVIPINQTVALCDECGPCQLSLQSYTWRPKKQAATCLHIIEEM